MKKRIFRKWQIQVLGLVYVLLLTGTAVSNPVNETVSTIKVEAESLKGDETENEIEDQTEGKEAPWVALTFDDGPHAVYTPELLDGLKKRRVHATFFLIGQNIEQGENVSIVKRMEEEGHLIGNHTYHHVDITKLDDESAYEEIRETNELIEAITGKPVEFMRPPFGAWQKELEKRVPLIPVLWTVDPLDWATDHTDEIVNKVVTETEEGDMILLHDCYKSSVEAALRIIDILQEKGFRFVTADEMIAA